ncbi:MAG: MerR family transcriptional regulator [Gemmatimonadaceae bacterium]|nr:MerR family transcriptional regulator [Gemmatimonadaceae bacterium]
MSGIRGEPVQEFYSIGEVCELTDLKPHVLRYWESQFRFINPAKNRSGNRVYARREIELILLVKHLLYTEKYTIDGARKKLDDHRRAGAATLRAQARAALDRDTLLAIERDLAQLVALVDAALPAPTPLDARALATSPSDS